MHVLWCLRAGGIWREERRCQEEQVLELIAPPLAVLIAKSSADTRKGGEMRGCDETTHRISMENGHTVYLWWVGVCVCVSVLVGGDGITGGRQGVRT